MIQKPADYEALTTATIADRLGIVEAVATRLGRDAAKWNAAEIGDGNLNLVFVVKSAEGALVVKQALPYLRVIGESWPLPLKRAFFEYQALVRQKSRAPGFVPEIYHFDESQALIVMEYLADHTILRYKLMAGERVEGLAGAMGRFVAQTAFRGSDLALDIDSRKADTCLFLQNVELCKITESLIFTDPYFPAERNRHTVGLDPVVAMLREDTAMKVRVQHFLAKFAGHAETLLHGDLHSGSIMCTDRATRIIDPEFATYGPMGFDLGMLLANFIMAFFSQPAYRNAHNLQSYQDWICDVIAEIVSTFEKEFARLWKSERTGILYPATLFEDQGQDASVALWEKLQMIWKDAVGFCGIEMHRRILSLAHNADFESIEDPAQRSSLEARSLLMGRDLIMQVESLDDCAQIVEMARDYNRRDCL